MAEWRVLVVDPDREAARLHCRHLAQQPGFKVVGVATSASQAAAMLGNLRPHLALLDIALPEGEGLLLLRRLRASGWPLEVIVATESTDAEVVRAAVRLGVVDYVVKPFHPERLRQSLCRFRRRSAAAPAGTRLAQRDIDELSRHAQRWLPRDLDPERLEQVRVVLASACRPLTAQDVGRATGVARTTARRYLEYLVTIDEATVENHRVGPGRPLKSYERHDAPIIGEARERRSAA
ncbi:MAG TPA: response regulator [Solirubrobacteraceae bacterium]|nr:response regulator [Solirubrobacteraceae bacterium]